MDVFFLFYSHEAIMKIIIIAIDNIIIINSKNKNNARKHASDNREQKAMKIHSEGDVLCVHFNRNENGF